MLYLNIKMMTHNIFSAARLKAILRRKEHGQGLVETALFFPVLLIVLSGLIEFGFLLNEYMAIQDATRNAARFAADGLYYAQDANCDCSTTRDFYRQVGCLVVQELGQERPEIELDFNNGSDEIVVSGLSITQAVGVTARHPNIYGENGWSGAEHMKHTPTDTGCSYSRNQNSRISSALVNSRINVTAPSTGFVVVEVFHDYQHKLGLPWITVFTGNPIHLHNYAIMPLVSAEPTPTPMP